jgi:hypothetical protein
MKLTDQEQDRITVKIREAQASMNARRIGEALEFVRDIFAIMLRDRGSQIADYTDDEILELLRGMYALTSDRARPH